MFMPLFEIVMVKMVNYPLPLPKDALVVDRNEFVERRKEEIRT
jgi:hypothetical protein